MASACPYATGRTKESENMLKNRLSRIALAAVLALGVLSIGTTQSSAIDVQNGIQGPYRVIKAYAVVGFQYGYWQAKVKNQAIEYECKNNDGYCYFIVSRSLFIDNCTTSAIDGADPGMCGVGAAEPQGIPTGFGSEYRCSKGSRVKTVSNLLFIPQTCIDEED
jgi:hypothetical protein